MFFSEVKEQIRAQKGVASAVSEKYQSNIHKFNYVSSRIVVVKMEAESEKLNIVSINLPEDNESEEEKESVYNSNSKI